MQGPYLTDVESTSLEGVSPLLDGLDAPVGRSGTPTDSQSICLSLEHDRSFGSYDSLPWKRKTRHNNESELDRCLKSFPSHEINLDYSRDMIMVVSITHAPKPDPTLILHL